MSNRIDRDKLLKPELHAAAKELKIRTTIAEKALQDLDTAYENFQTLKNQILKDE